jgi:hypothetical protein
MMVALTEVKFAGIVTDPDGQPVQSITVDLLNSCAANVIQTTTTDVEGWFQLWGKEGLPEAPWKIRFSDPSGKYATSFYGADDFDGATLAPPDPDAEFIKVLQLTPPDIEVAPQTHDFGDVVLPGSATAIVTVANRGGTDLHISSLALASGSSPYIWVKSAPATPITLTSGTSCEVSLEFKPQSLGAPAGTLVIGSDDPDEGTVVVTLSGNGVASSAPPGNQVAATLVFIEESVNDGTLQGTGPAGAGSAHVQALMDQIKAASDLATAGKLQPACKQLENALQRTDGDPKPLDFVSGPAAEELRLLIELTRISMGCE